MRLHRKALLAWDNPVCQERVVPGEGLTLKVKVSRKAKKARDVAPLLVTADGKGMTGRAGTGLLGRVADRVGLTDGLSQAVGGCRSWVEHDPGKVVRDLVLMLADGGDALRHLKVLDGQRELFGEVASAATANRTIIALADDELVVERLADPRREARAQVWATGGQPPVISAARGAWEAGDRQTVFRLDLDLDATLITCWCDDREGLRRAAATYKKGWGTHPLVGYLDRGDGLGEALAGLLRPGNAGSLRHEVAQG